MCIRDRIITLTILFLGPNIYAVEVDVFNGMKLYAENCAGCHMGNLAGHEEWNKSLDEDGHRRAPPLNGTGHTWHHSPKYLFQVTKYGFKKLIPDYEGKMLGNDSLSDDDVWSIIEFIKSTWPENILNKYNSHFKN